MSAVDLKNLPSLPGFSFPQYKDNHARAQTWNVHNGQRIESKPGLSHDKPRFVKALKPQENWRTGSLPDSTTRSVFKANAPQAVHTELPAWDAFDRHVLRFHGFFKEPVVEANLENYRVRRVMIYYYLEDDTCQIIEPRQDNSGIPQGQLVRRHRFPAQGGGYVQTDDLQVGEVLHIYGKSIQLTDCDDFTRKYYEQAGQEQGPSVETERDPFVQTREALKSVNAAQPRTYEKLYREVMLGGGHVNADMQQFLENDRKVLRFFCIMDDVSTPQFERRPFVILFFLADDQLEIREMYPLNCGRDNFPIFYRKARMPIGDYKVDGPQAQARKKTDYVHGHDFAVGLNVTLLGNFHFFIYDADDFTRAYFREELGVELDPKVDVQLPDRAVPRAKTPDYTGYGSWDDSMASVTHLIPKPPRKDVEKLFVNDGKVLRFKARFVDPKPEDTERVFVISFNLADDTLSIHEPPQRNLGIVTGKFLEKSVHLNQLTGALFEPADLAPGQRIKVYNHEFEILDMDEYTAKMFADPTTRHTTFDLEAVVNKLRESMRQQYPLARDIFRRFDGDHDGVMTLAEFRKALEKFGFQLSHEEVLMIMRHFDTRRDGQVSYNEFCDCLLDEDYTTRMMHTKPRLQQHRDESYADRALAKTMERQETVEVRKAVRAISDVVYKKQNMLVRIFKEIGHITHHSYVDCSNIQDALRQLGHSFEIEDIHRMVLFILPGCDPNRVNYVELFKALVTAYHDLSVHR